MRISSSFTRLLVLLAAISLPGSTGAITIGQGPVIGTNKNANVLFGSAIWYQEFQDWSKNDVRAVDTNADQYNFGDAYDTARDIIAFYSHDDGTNVFFRLDFFELGFNVQDFGLDVYVAIDCAAGGNGTLPDSVETTTDHPWDVCVAVYNSGASSLYDSGGGTHPGDFLGSYWRADLDGVEFGIKRSRLIAQGWNGTSPLHLQAYTCRDGTGAGAGEIGSGSDLVDVVGASLNRNTGGGTGHLTGGLLSTATSGRAKYAVIAHANQSVATKSGTQGHIYTDFSSTLKPGFIRMLDTAEFLNIPINLHISGTLLMSFQWATQNPAESGYPNRDGPTFLGRVKRFVTTGPGSLIGGVLAEHIMPYFEGDVNRKSIEQNNEVIDTLFGLSVSNMGVMHIPERVFHTNTNSPHVNPNGPIKGKPFEDIVASGFKATYLDEVTHLHWWFYPNETTNPGWDDANCGRWAGGLGNDEEPYHHKVHKINGVYCFMINDREDQEKFGNDDSGMQQRTRYSLLQKALNPDSSQLTLVFDDWEAFAGNSFASPTPNGNADQWDRTIRWAANHQWIEIVNLKDILGYALGDPSWVVDHGTNNFNHSTQTYEWLKRASEQSYDNWYYGTGQEQSFFDRVPPVINSFVPGGMKKYGDMNTTNTLIRDSWDRIKTITSTNMKKLAEWAYSAMIYETAWHDEDANPDKYKSRNYQVDFNRNISQGNCDESEADSSYDPTSGWALRLHGHARHGGVMKAASDWVQNIKNGSQGPAPTLYAADIDDDQIWEYVLCNNKVFLCYERWGARLVKAFTYDPNVNGGDAIPVIGVSISNPPEETENEGQDNNRCSVFKDRYTSSNNNAYVDMDFALTPPIQGSNSWTFVSANGSVRKKMTLQHGRDVVMAEYNMSNSVGQMFTRYGLGPNQLDLMLKGHTNLVSIADASFRGLKNLQGGEAYLISGRNMGFINGSILNAGWDNREMPLLEQFESYTYGTNWTVSLAFSEASARDVDGDGLSNTNEIALGTNHELWDTDGDNMPDGYEVANQLNPIANDAGVDSDLDGIRNADEYVANTLANNSNSFLHVTNIVRDTASITVTHPVSAPRNYQIYFSDGFANSWTWLPFGNTNHPVGSYLETNVAVQAHSFTDDFTVATSGGLPTNGLRIYSIRVTVPN